MDVDDERAALLPLALGHDQEAAACPWVQLTRRTTDYPSRKAQAALAVLHGAVPVTPDLVELFYRCDDCGRCRTWSTLAAPPDLGRALWAVRASLVRAGAVPEVASLAATLRDHGNVYGDLGSAWERLGPRETGTGVLFVPGAGTLFHCPDAAVAAVDLVRTAVGPVNLRPDLGDSGQVLFELGLADEARESRHRLRRRVADAGYRLVLAATPKEAWSLRQALTGLPIEVRYAAAAVADAVLAGRLPRLMADRNGAIVFHPSETLLHRLDEFDLIARWLGHSLGERYRPEPEPRRHAWPAAIERPAVRVPTSLTRALARHRLEQLLALDPSVILTTDPFSWLALREVAPAGIEVVDLLVFAARLGEGRSEHR